MFTHLYMFKDTNKFFSLWRGKYVIKLHIHKFELLFTRNPIPNIMNYYVPSIDDISEEEDNSYIGKRYKQQYYELISGLSEYVYKTICKKFIK